MRERLLFLISILILAIFSTSFRWPVDDGRITSTFAESRGDHFHDGIDMICQDDKIYPVDTGRLLFYWDRSIFPLENHPGGGNYVILSHENKYYSIYLHLEEGLNTKNYYKKSDLLGMIGNSGHSYARHLHFSMLEKKSWSSINPFLKMPEFKDDKPPVIGELYFKIDEKYINIRNNSSIRLTQHYPILIKIIDVIKGNEKLGIYKLVVTHNQKKAVEAVFDRIDFSKDGLNIKKKNFFNVFDEAGYYKVEGIKFQEGQNLFTVSAWDYSENFSEKEFTLDVDLDME